MWLRAFAAEMPLLEELLNCCQVVVEVAGPQYWDRRYRGYQSWIHSWGSHTGEVPLSPVLSMDIHTKATGQITSAPDNDIIQRSTSCLPPTIFCPMYYAKKKKHTASFTPWLWDLIHTDSQKDLQKQNKESGKEIRLHSRDSKLERINTHQLNSLSIKRP